MSKVVVTAPADLQEGFTFDAAANGKTIKVTVPPGGVKAGDDIEVALPTDDEAKKTDSEGAPVPTGRFKNKLCDCFETCPCPFFMGCCCPGILTGQVLQRLKLNPIGMPGDYENTCMIMTGIFFAAWFLAILVGALTNVGYVIWYAFYLYIIVALTLARKTFREKYNIPGTTFGESALDDCCCAFWCGCCTILQMHRHTHDESKYPYEMGSKTGLPSYAPEIV